MTPPQVEETIWIALSDGCRLAARLWMPGDRKGPVPAILEYLPYRRRDRHRGDDAILHPAFAMAGYAAIRVDMRGAGDSDGVMTDEYTTQEWADAVEVIAWIARQDWCSGNVGMIGLSWSGFNSLQIAAMAPPALKAVVTTCASDDRYGDDMHYMGGCLLNDNLQYGATLFTWLGTPPDPAIVGADWRDMWLARLAAVEPPAARWMQHSDRDAYWRSGSVREDYTRIQAAVLAVGGWADGYTNAVLRLLEGLPGPRKGLIGPWAHAFPHVATPGPRIDFLAYVVRWWDHWLKGRDTGMMDEPMLTCWMQESEPPHARYTTRKGRWVAEPVWPSPQGQSLTLHLTTQGLRPEAGALVGRVICSPTFVGLASGEWCPYGWGPDMPTDQREDDAGSLCFDGAPLDASVQMLGGPRLDIEFSSDQAEGTLAVRLVDLTPDGSARRITYGLLNLQHHAGHERAIALKPGQRYRATVSLKDVAYELPAGHRLRVAVSTSYWPLAMPGPTASTITLHDGTLHLPRRETMSDERPPPLGTAWNPPPLKVTVLTPPKRGRIRIERNLVDNRIIVDVVRNLGAIHIADVDIELQALGSEKYTIGMGDPSHARSETQRRAEFRRDDWHATVVTSSNLTSAGADWSFKATLDAYDGEARIFSRKWNLLIPRSSADRTRAEESAIGLVPDAVKQRGQL